jgi:hypothetical protein
MTHTATPVDPRHGTSVSTRSDQYGLDKQMFPADPDWPDGLELFIYDDGRVKIGGWHTATVEAVRTFASITGNDSRDGSHVMPGSRQPGGRPRGRLALRPGDEVRGDA